MSKTRINVETLCDILLGFLAIVAPFAIWFICKVFKIGVYAPRVQIIMRPVGGKETSVSDTPKFVASKCLRFFHELLKCNQRIVFPPNDEPSLVFVAMDSTDHIVSTWILCGPKELVADMKNRIETYLSVKPLSALVV